MPCARRAWRHDQPERAVVQAGKDGKTVGGLDTSGANQCRINHRVAGNARLWGDWPAACLTFLHEMSQNDPSQDRKIYHADRSDQPCRGYG